MQLGTNETVLTKKDIIKLQNLSILKSSWIVAIFAVVFVLLAFRIKDGQLVFESIFFAVIGAITYPAYFVIIKLILIKQNKRIPQKTTYLYQFFDDRIISSATDGIVSEQFISKYTDIKNYKINKKYIQIDIEKNVSLLVDKQSFTNPSEQERIEKLLAMKISSARKK